MQWLQRSIKCHQYDLITNSVLRKSLHNETNFSRCEFTEKFCEFFNLIFNSVRDLDLIEQFFPLGLNAL